MERLRKSGGREVWGDEGVLTLRSMGAVMPGNGRAVRVW
jgi:hypothetical protein